VITSVRSVPNNLLNSLAGKTEYFAGEELPRTRACNGK
jgi:hypothetical protein